MRSRRSKNLSPRVDHLEVRRLLSLAVLELDNKSSYNIHFDFRWSPSESWSSYYETPGQGETFWHNYSDYLTPQVRYYESTSIDSLTTESLVQGYGQFNGTGNPPPSSATLYQFQNTATGVFVNYVSPPTPTEADVVVQNDSSYTITFGFRWDQSSNYSYYSEGPGQGRIFWIDLSSSLAPNVLFDTSSSPGSQVDVTLAQGFGEWVGQGEPPQSTAHLYSFQNTSSGVGLYDGAPPPSNPNPNQTPVPNPNAQSSPNWSGYAISAQAGSVTQVNGSWIVPAVTGPSNTTLDSSTWVGIDGDGNNTVEQIGTEQDSINGTPFYRAWWEMFSTNAPDGVLGKYEVPIDGFTVSPGDSISALVQYQTSGPNAGQYELSITDKTRNESYTTYQSSSATQVPLASNSTAEWIMESPQVAGSFVQVPNFSPVTFTNATAVINGQTGSLGSFQPTALNLVTSGVPIDTTSNLDSSGEIFTVTSDSGLNTGGGVASGVNTSQPQSGGNDPQQIIVGYQPPPSGALQLAVVGQPSSVTAGSPFSLTVNVEDAGGNVDASYTGPVTVSLVGTSGVLGGNLTVDAVDGVATFPGLSITTAGVYAITVSSGTLQGTSLDLSVTGTVARPSDDYNGDGKTDVAVYLPSLGAYAIKPSDGASPYLVPFGPAGAGQSIPVAGNYSGNGKTDIAVYIPSLGAFAIEPSDGSTPYLVPFGPAGQGQSIPVAGNYSGNGKTDIAVYIPSLGAFAIEPSDGSTPYLVPFGPAGAGQSIPVAGDFDGDGKTDIAVYIPSIGDFAIKPSDGATPYLVPFGPAGAGQSIPVAGDFDGDGKTDIAVFIPALGTFAIEPSDGAAPYLVPFGIPGAGNSIPAPGDYDGSGKTEVAVYLPTIGLLAYRPANGGPDQYIPFGPTGYGQSLPVNAQLMPLPTGAIVNARPHPLVAGRAGASNASTVELPSTATVSLNSASNASRASVPVKLTSAVPSPSLSRGSSGNTLVNDQRRDQNLALA